MLPAVQKMRLKSFTRRKLRGFKYAHRVFPCVLATINILGGRIVLQEHDGVLSMMVYLKKLITSWSVSLEAFKIYYVMRASAAAVRAIPT